MVYKGLVYIFLITWCYYSSAQNYSTEKVALSNYIKRMYIDTHFEGVRVLASNYDKEEFLISVVSLNSNDYLSEQAMNRVAEVKARSQASRYFNGANITSEMIIVMNEDSSGRTISSTEKIRETSFGNMRALELLSTFSVDNNDDIIVFIYYSPMNKSNSCKKSKKQSIRQ